MFMLMILMTSCVVLMELMIPVQCSLDSSTTKVTSSVPLLGIMSHPSPNPLHEHVGDKVKDSVSLARIVEDEFGFEDLAPKEIIDEEEADSNDLSTPDTILSDRFLRFGQVAHPTTDIGSVVSRAADPSGLESPFESLHNRLRLSLHGLVGEPALSVPVHEIHAKHRNDCTNLNEKIPSHLLRSTGTTIAGVLCEVVDSCPGESNNGTDQNTAGTSKRRQFVVLGADTRATDGSMVADKECHKIHCLVPRTVYACGAGTSADLEAVTRRLRYSLQLKTVQEQTIGNYGRIVTEDTVLPSLKTTVGVATVCNTLKGMLYKSRGRLGVNLIVGGMDVDGGARLVAIHPHGSMDTVPYAALGSGGLAALATLESRWHNLGKIGHNGPIQEQQGRQQCRLPTLEEGRRMVMDAIKAGIENDLGSGSHINLRVLGPDGFSTEETHFVDASSTTKERYAGNEKDELHDNSSNGSNNNKDDDNDDDSEGNKSVGEFGRNRFQDDSVASIGVNGFGNTPYKELSRRNLYVVGDADKTRREWNERLGIL